MATTPTTKSTVNFRKLAYSPTVNPFAEPTVVEVKQHTRRRHVRTATSQELVDPTTGEVKAISMVHTVEEKDDAEFVKVFASGVKAAFELKAAGARVFQAVLSAYEREKMTGGFADCVTLFWFNDGLNGSSIGMSEYTFQRGLRELIEKQFLLPKMPNVYWTNPALFFKGDRVAFVKEYRRKTSECISVIEKPKSKKTAHAKAGIQADLFESTSV